MNVEALYKQIGATIRRKRKQLGLTQQQLATRMATSRAALANIETGRQNVLVHQLYRFAANLDLKVEDLLPAMANPDTASSPSEFPLPEGLNRAQREQITRLLDGASTPSVSSKKANNGS